MSHVVHKCAAIAEVFSLPAFDVVCSDNSWKVYATHSNDDCESRNDSLPESQGKHKVSGLTCAICAMNHWQGYGREPDNKVSCSTESRCGG